MRFHVYCKYLCLCVCVRLNVFVNRFYFCLFFFRLSTLDFRCCCCFSFVVVAIRSILLEIDGKYHNFQEKNTRILKINQQRILKYFVFVFVYFLFLFNHETSKNRRTFDFTFEPKRNVNNFFHLILIYFNYVHIFILLYTHLYIDGSVLLAERNWNFVRLNFFLFFYILLLLLKLEMTPCRDQQK